MLTVYCKEWFTDVQLFADGNFNNFGYNRAWIFCGDNYQEEYSADDPAFQPDGTKYPTGNGYLKLRDVRPFADHFKNGLTPFWIPGINGYFFDKQNNFQPGTPGSNCSKVLAFTGAARFESFTKSKYKK